jgi:hypothetical protein
MKEDHQDPNHAAHCADPDLDERRVRGHGRLRPADAVGLFSFAGDVRCQVPAGYRVAKSLMYRKREDEKKLTASRETIQKVFYTKQPGVPYELLKLMMDLSYSGYRELALKMADDTWPRDLSGLAKFKLDFNRALAASPYWTEFYAPWALNNPTLILAR